jgi:N-acetyl-1-D-myo-inositol-2-amino-2-deoxy-alpha-D-glucopyranoside deacetylase
MATAGELGESRVPLRPARPCPSARARARARRRAARGVAAGAARQRDSARRRPPAPTAARWRGDPLRLARRVAELADGEGACALLHDDEHGVYGHPDHRAVFRSAPPLRTCWGITSYGVTSTASTCT